MGHSPVTLRAAAVIQAAESVMVLVASVLAGIDTAVGRSYHNNSGIALTAIGIGTAAALAWVAAGLARARRWSRTPALLTQLFVGIVGIYLLQSHRLDWGVTSIVLAAGGFAALLAPPSLRALAGRPRSDQPAPRQSGQAARTPSGPSTRTPAGQPAGTSSGQPARKRSGQPADEPSGRPAKAPSRRPARKRSGQPARKRSGS
jgi:hypothetical protein